MKADTSRALIVDDSPVLVLQLQQVLQQLGVEAAVYDQAVHSEAEMKRYAVIFVELMQGGGNGFQKLRELAKTARCPLVLLSGTNRASDKPWSRQAGAAAVLERPLNRSKVAHCLQALGLVPASNKA